MAWDDTPPTSADLGSSWDAAPPTQAELNPPSYLEDVLTNAGKEVKALPGQIPAMVSQGLGIASVPMDALKAAPELLEGKKPSETSLAEDLAPVGPGVEQTAETVAHPIDSFRKAPINTAMTAAGLLGLKSSLAEPEIAEAPKEAPETPGATPPTPPSGEASEAGAGENPPPPPSGTSPFESAAQTAEDAAKEVQDYISRGYEGYAKKPGALADIEDWMQEKSQALAAQQMGFTPNQARQLGKTPLEGHNAMRAIGQYAYDKGIVSEGTNLSGMLKKNAELTKSVGKTLGDYREMADKLAGEVDPKEVVAEVRKALDDKYMRTITTPEGEESAPRGAYGGQSGAYLKALQEVEDADKSHSGIAEAATELNHAANKAAKNMQPETPFTDVANEVSRINNEKIKALIGQDNAAKYEQALREYGVNKKIANALKFKASGEVKRFGPGGVMSNLTQKGLDEFGYRLLGKSANRLATALKNNPSIAANLPSLFKEFIHQVEDVGHDVTGMAHGGVVPPDVREWVSAR